MAASGLGLIVGSLGAGWAAARWGTAVAYGGSIGLMSLMLGATAVVSTVWVAAIFVVAYGLGNGIAVVVNSLLVQRGIPDHLRGRAFTLAMSLTYSALFIGMLAGGFISDAYGARWAWGVASMMAGVAAVASYALARGIPAGEEHVEVEPFPIVSAAAPDPAELGALHE
jgi:MFS family permease